MVNESTFATAVFETFRHGEELAFRATCASIAARSLRALKARDFAALTVSLRAPAHYSDVAFLMRFFNSLSR